VDENNFTKIFQIKAMEIIRKEDLTTSQWSGGSTTQLYIYPKHALYQKSDFDFRLSSARVKVEASTFTKLEGISRFIMILEGETLLTHQQRDTVHLKKFDIDYFEGHWDTTSRGKVVDYNLMLNQNHEGHLRQLSLKKDQVYQIETEYKKGFLICYLFQGQLSINDNGKDYLINKNDTLVFKPDEDKTKIAIKAFEDCVLIISDIRRKKPK
jgi:uncharacterized protein